MTPADQPPPSTSAEIIEYLLDERLITTRDIVDGDVRAVPVGGRNRNVRVVSANGRSYFVKQAEPGDATAAETVAREAAFYERVRDDDAWTGLRDVVPRCLAFDSRRALLTLELIADACNAHELDDIDGPTAFPRIGALLGAALAACHAAPSRATNATARDAAVEHDLGPPWILDLARPTPSMLRDFSSAQVELVQRVQGAPPVCDALDRLRDGWTATSLVHRDIKWGNVLVRTALPSREPERLWLADWEFASWGDPAWDVASAFHSFVADCVHAVSHEVLMTGADASAAFNAALPRVQEQMREFWRVYAGARRFAGPASQEFLARAVRCCGARLLQSAYEWSHGELHLPRNAVAALQLGVNILRAPAATSAAMLGFAADSVTG